MKKVLLTVTVVLLATALGLSTAGAAGSSEATQTAAPKTIVLKLGTSYPAAAPETQAADRFAEVVKEKTNGQVVVQVFPSEQLGPAKTELEATMLGNQDLFLEGSVWYERWSETLRFLGVPFAFENREHFRKWTRSEDWKKAWSKVTEASGLVFLDKGNWERGPFRVIVSKKPIKSLDDLKGLKLRVWPADAYKRSWEALGAKTTELAWTDVYLALKLGTVDAVTSPVSLVYPMKFTEVAKHIIYWPEFPQVVRMAMNQKKYDSLSPEIQKVLAEAATEAGDLYTKISQDLAEKDIDKCINEHGADYYKGMDLKAAAAHMADQIKKFESEGYLPAGVYDRIRALAK